MIPFFSAFVSLAACTDAPVDHEETWAAVRASSELRAELRSPAVDLRAQLSDAVFAGRVVDIEYRDADAVDGAGPVPFTFVTWQVERAWKGLDTGDRFTARFMGGRAQNGVVLTGSEQPNFLLGDRDVLFVDSTLEGACPLVGCAFGRYRLVEGRVYGNDGHALAVADNGELARVGGRDLAELHLFDDGAELHETPMSGPTAVGGESSDEPTFFGWLDARLPVDAGLASPRSARRDDPLVVPAVL